MLWEAVELFDHSEYRSVENVVVSGVKFVIKLEVVAAMAEAVCSVVLVGWHTWKKCLKVRVAIIP